MREAGDVCYADVYRDGTGVVEFLRYDDMKYAIRKLDDTKFKSHEVNQPCFPSLRPFRDFSLLWSFEVFLSPSSSSFGVLLLISCD